MNLFASVRRHPLPWILSVCAVLVIAVAVTVYLLFLAPVRVDEISLDKTELVFHSMSQTYQLTPSTQPSPVSHRALIWTSSDPTVATVSEKGVVTPVGNGKALISVRGSRGGGIAHCTVTVSVVSSITFPKNEIFLPVNRSQALQYTLTPETVDASHLVWTSSDPSVVSVDASGIVTALKRGSAVITLATADGALHQTCIVIVTENIPVTGIEFPVTEFVFDSEDDVLVLTPVFTPQDTSQREVKWLSSDPSVATVNEETGAVTPISNGVTTIIAQSVHGDFSASCTVTVNLQIPVRGISFSKESYTFKGLKQTYLIRPVFDPANASNQKITWTSSDPSVAKVSDQGMVTAL